MNRINIYFKKWKLFSFHRSCKHHKFSKEVFQTLYGHGLMCHNCKQALTYERWPKGYDLNAVPDWSKTEAELVKHLTKGGKC